jgi:hypothetical protein
MQVEEAFRHPFWFEKPSPTRPFSFHEGFLALKLFFGKQWDFMTRTP